MSVIIIGGGGHNNITRLVYAKATGQMSDAQADRFQEILDALEELAQEVAPT